MGPRRLLLVIGLSVLELAACSQPAPIRDKPYYLAHEAERASQLSACQTDPGRLAATSNCINAQAADAEVHAARFYDAPKPASRVAAPERL